MHQKPTDVTEMGKCQFVCDFNVAEIFYWRGDWGGGVAVVRASFTVSILSGQGCKVGVPADLPLFSELTPCEKILVGVPAELPLFRSSQLARKF